MIKPAVQEQPRNFSLYNIQWMTTGRHNCTPRLLFHRNPLCNRSLCITATSYSTITITTLPQHRQINWV
ncbi:hypothetical protein AQUCO_04400147v1 [Aquilegia coerulea]|uniref:Uncharacterized protein n=1 Tax=Aquilegia coerulea TaxID=218851 RepID=A0A2G5CN83_AQUCA|nr:hypothetical protein AQUCO_04400147v1 [Aquilegia coerulea]